MFLGKNLFQTIYEGEMGLFTQESNSALRKSQGS